MAPKFHAWQGGCRVRPTDDAADSGNLAGGLRDRIVEQAVWRAPVLADAAVGDQPLLADLAELVEVVAGMVGADIGPGDPVGARGGRVAPGQVDLRSRQMMPRKACPMHRLAAHGPVEPALLPGAD